jgi:succinate dehydrogenase/fumarate reductase cytochrome b subunit (b558 family)
MAQIAQPLTEPLEPTGRAADLSFVWRRLHSLTGIVPVGFFLLFHTFENMTALRGEAAYNSAIAKLAEMLPTPWFYLVEVGVILLPLLFHGLYGVFLAFEGSPNPGAYVYRRNYLYLLQRVTGVLVLAFVVYHVITLRVHLTMRGLGAGVPGHEGYVAFADLVQAMASPGVLALYVVGIVSAGFHFGNGLSGFLWTWGVAVGERSRRGFELLGWALSLAVALPMLAILWKFRA